MGTSTGTTSAGKKPYDPYSMAPQTMAANAPSTAYSAGDSGSDRTGLMQMNQMSKPGLTPPALPGTNPDMPIDSTKPNWMFNAPQANPAQLPGYDHQQAAPTGNIDPYTGTTQSSANMTTAELMAFQDAARANANPANNPANATQSANGDLNAIQGQNPNVFNPYTAAADPNAGQGSRVGATGTNTITPNLPTIGTPPGPVTSGQGGYTSAQGGTSVNPYLIDQAKSIMEMQNQNLHEGAFMNIRDQSMMNGGYGGDRQGIAEGVAIRGADMNTRSALANLFGGAYENQAGRDLSRYQGDQSNATNRFGITTGAQTAAMNLQGQQAMANAQLQAGQENNRNSFYTAQRGQDFEQQRLAAQLYGQGQQGMLSGYGQLGGIYDQNYQAPWQQLSQFANLAAPLSGGSASTTTGGGPSGGQQAAVIAAQLAAAYFSGGTSLMAGSDPSMKKNVKRVGTTNDALGIYDFEYKKEYENDPFNSPGKKRGLMADEVEAKYPHAVMDRGDGKKLVNYGLMGYRAP
jgi:hypothetical protein